MVRHRRSSGRRAGCHGGSAPDVGRDGWSAPTPLAALLRRGSLAPLMAVGAAHVALSAIPHGGWSCPLMSATGLPCPGCGLGRATAALLRGDVGEALHLHAFAPVAVIGLALLGVAAIAPPLRTRLAAPVERLEAATGISVLLGVALVVYWLGRLAWKGTELSSLLAV